MTISKLIAELQIVQAQHGDIVVVAHDGMDPSDECPVKCVDVVDFLSPRSICEPVKAARIYAE